MAHAEILPIGWGGDCRIFKNGFMRVREIALRWSIRVSAIKKLDRILLKFGSAVAPDFMFYVLFSGLFDVLRSGLF